MLQACLNGGRSKQFNAAVPCTADELARDAEAVVRLGAAELHVHPRDRAGKESLHPDDIAPALQAIRASVPGTPVGLSTGWWLAPGGRARHQQIRDWRVLPDFVSVNLIEEDAPEIIALVQDKGIGVEAGIWSVRDARRYVDFAGARQCLRVLIEINEQDAAVGLRVAKDIFGILDGADIRLPRLLHGADATMWPLYRAALEWGLDTRIGLEDGGYLPTGEQAGGNAALIAAAQALARTA